MTYVEKKKQSKARQIAEDRSVYRELLHILATAGKLAPKDEQRFETIVGRLVISDETVEKELAVLEKVTALTAAVAPRAGIVAAIAACEGDFAELNRRKVAADAEHDEKVQGVSKRHTAAQDRLTAVNKAFDDLTALQNTHAELLELPDPAAEARKKHLVQVVFGRPASPTHGLVEFESLMSDPKAQASLLRHDSETIWVPVDGQSEAELQELLALARQLVAGGKRASYVLSNTDAERVVCCKDSVKFADLTKRLNPDQRYFVGEYAWQAAPGQNAEQFEKCVAAITRKEQVTTDAVTTVLMTDPNHSTWATKPMAM